MDIDTTQNSTLNDYSYGKEYRLLKRGSFQYLARKAMKVHHERMTLQSLHCTGSLAKSGFTVSKKVGKAPVRQLIKRRLRHFFRHHKEETDGYHWVVIVKPGLDQIPYHDLAEILQRLIVESKKRHTRRKQTRRRT